MFSVFCVLGNKCDLRQERKVSEEEAQEYAASIGALYYETSALTNEGQTSSMIQHFLIIPC